MTGRLPEEFPSAHVRRLEIAVDVELAQSGLVDILER